MFQDLAHITIIFSFLCTAISYCCLRPLNKSLKELRGAIVILNENIQNESRRIYSLERELATQKEHLVYTDEKLRDLLRNSKNAAI